MIRRIFVDREEEGTLFLGKTQSDQTIANQIQRFNDHYFEESKQLGVACSEIKLSPFIEFASYPFDSFLPQVRRAFGGSGCAHKGLNLVQRYLTCLFYKIFTSKNCPDYNERVNFTTFELFLRAIQACVNKSSVYNIGCSKYGSHFYIISKILEVVSSILQGEFVKFIGFRGWSFFTVDVGIYTMICEEGLLAPLNEWTTEIRNLTDTPEKMADFLLNL